MGKKGKAGGKQPKGRAAQRGKAQKNSPGGFGKQFAWDDSDDEQPQKGFRGFNQAGPPSSSRNTPNVKLRHQAISFVSAGSNTPAEPEDATLVEEEVTLEVGAEDDEESEDEEEEELDDSAIETNIMVDTDIEITDGTAKMDIDSPPQQPLFFVDTEGDPAFANMAGPTERQIDKQRQSRVRTPSPARSDSSEEVVLFRGRGKAQVAAAAPKPAQESHVTDDLLAALGQLSTPSVPAPAPQPQATAANGPLQVKGWAARPAAFDQQQQQASTEWQSAPSVPYWRKGKPRPDLDPSAAETKAMENAQPRDTKVTFSEPARDDARDMDAEDTISSLQADWKATLRGKKAKKKTEAPRAVNGDSDGSIVEKTAASSKSTRRGKKARKQDNRQLRQAIESDDEDAAAEAAYDDYMQNLAAQLAADEADVGTESKSVAAALRVDLDPSEVMISANEKSDEWEDEDSEEDSDDEIIGQDLSEVSLDDVPLNLSDLESSDLEDELFYTEQEQWEDEEDLRQRRVTAMTDEKIARLFAKQQELGIDSEDIVIDDGAFEYDDEGIGDLLEARIGLHNITNTPSGRPRNKNGMRTSRRKGAGFSFPDASALADSVEQYGENGFDIMDYERPSLRNTKKGRKGKLPEELDDALSDEDLKDQLQGAWDKDRAKKRLKKAEREELRQQGLLGKKNSGKADLGYKYQQGMTMDQVHEELRAFLQDDGLTTRPFPPMDKHDRKALHQIADMMNLKSKSVGSGNKRFPVLYKTQRTLEYDEVYFARVLKTSKKGFLKNASAGNKFGGKGRGGGKLPPQRAGRGGGFDKAAVTIRDGEVVGGDAKAIGQESVGHRLMEKMGWSAGKALGKDGEGLLVPVEQRMRTGTRGLG